MEGKADTRLELLITIVDYSLRKVLRDLYKRIKLPFYLQSQGYGSAESEIYEEYSEMTVIARLFKNYR